MVTQYLGEAVEGVLHSLQHAAGSLLLREKQILVDAEQSRELGHIGVNADSTKDLSRHSNGAAALGIKQKMDEGAAGNNRDYIRVTTLCVGTDVRECAVHVITVYFTNIAHSINTPIVAKTNLYSGNAAMDVNDIM